MSTKYLSYDQFKKVLLDIQLITSLLETLPIKEFHETFIARQAVWENDIPDEVDLQTIAALGILQSVIKARKAKG